jgi:hypothetical protein
MNYYLDTEFQAWGSHISLLSVGIVCADGREYYAWNAEANWAGCEPWVKRNVILLLDHPIPAFPESRARTYEQIRDEVAAFVSHEKPEFWAYFADYDWVALCGLFGRLMDLPGHWPQFCLDLKQQAYLYGRVLPEYDPALEGLPEHHALGDARWTARAHKEIR